MLGQLLVALDDRVGAWGVNQIDLAQPGYRDVDNAIVILRWLLLEFRAITQQMDLVSGRGHAFD